MGADKNTDFSFPQSFQYGFGLSCRTGTAQIFHPAGQILQTFTECLEMLIGKDGRRHKDRHLFIIGYGFERCTDRYFCLSETHISAHQAIHRTVAFHIGLHLHRCLTLVGRIFIDKGGFQFTLQEAVGAVRETLFLTALRI